jgi:hypothetical protein
LVSHGLGEAVLFWYGSYAQHLKAACFALSELKAESLYHAVKQEMASRIS